LQRRSGRTFSSHGRLQHVEQLRHGSRCQSARESAQHSVRHLLALIVAGHALMELGAGCLPVAALRFGLCFRVAIGEVLANKRGRCLGILGGETSRGASSLGADPSQRVLR